MIESMSNAAKHVIRVATALALVVVAARANAAVVSGVYTSPGGTPLGDHQLHFENRISGDMYLTRTGGDGSFASDLPPGIYDLRAERGLIVKSGIRVGGPDLSVGRVTDGAPFDVRRPFERQGIGPAIVDTEAPATAHLETSPSGSGASSQPGASSGGPTGQGPMPAPSSPAASAH
jgi:hypothetical protein